MSDICTRPSVGKRRGNQTKIFVENRERTRSHASKTEYCQRIVTVIKDSKIIEESGVAYVRKVKQSSQSFSPVKERKKYDYPKFQNRQTSDNQKNPPSAFYLCGKVHWAKDCPYRTKNVKTAINSDIRCSQCRNRKIIKNRVRHTKSEDESKSFVNT